MKEAKSIEELAPVGQVLPHLAQAMAVWFGYSVENQRT